MVLQAISAYTRITKHAGLSLIELLLTIGLLTITLSAAIPSIRDLLLNQRMRSDHSRLTMDLLYARSLAVSQGQRVVICPSSGGNSCLQNPYWESGWLLFIDENNDRNYNEGEVKLRAATALTKLVARSSRTRSQIRFFPDGSATGSAATITLCGPRGVQFARAIVISNSGRVRQLRSSVDRNQLNCP